MKPGSFNYLYGGIIYCRTVILAFLIPLILIYLLDPKTNYLISSQIPGTETFPLFALFFFIQLYTITAFMFTFMIDGLGLNMIHVLYLGWILFRLNKYKSHAFSYGLCNFST
jgi:hypothetical protein